MSTAFAVLCAAAGFAALELADAHLFKPQGMSCMCPPLGAVAVLLFAMPAAPASKASNVLIGHLLSSLVALLVVTYLPAEYAIFAKGTAVAASIGVMTLTGTTHPPAGAYAFLFVAQKMVSDARFEPAIPRLHVIC